MRNRSILRSKEYATFKKMLTLMLIISPAVFLASCSDAPTAKTVAQCMTKDSSEFARCTENSIKSISDEWVRNCVIGNLSEKDDLSKRMVNSTITSEDMKDIDGVVKECMYYQDMKGTNVKNNDGYPVFSSFVSSAAGSFVGNYIAQKVLFDGVNDYSKTSYEDRQKKYSTGSVSSTSSSHYYGGTSGSNYGKVSNDGSKTDWYKAAGSGNGGKDTIGTVDKQYKESTWNVKQMKDTATLSKTNGYKLGDTGKNWSNVADSFRASKSSGFGSLGKSTGGSSVGGSSSKGSSSLG